MKIKAITVAALLTASAMLPVLAATAGQFTITADTITYNGKTGVTDIKGNVVITQDDKTMTAASGWFNTKNQQAYLTGGVHMTGPDESLTAESLQSNNSEEFTATGDVAMHKGNRAIYGSSVTYNSGTGYGVVQGGGRLVTPDATLQANYIEAYVNRVSAHAVGQVHLTSDTHQLNATANEVTYNQTPGQQDGVAYLIGNAHAVQHGNVLDAPKLKIELSNNSVQTMGGRSTLVITPK